MDSKSTTSTEETTTREQAATESADEYNLPVELFAGIVILIMGCLVLVTPLIYDMPTDLVWNPLIINLFSGSIYLVVGVIFIYRSDYIQNMI
ncbi:hypothetical protein [Halalkalicoccus tibetensis]|uniref:Cox cluster protein n=1 Tax=Halalkalicoccus tibetensis TaxID=175632 RepID=A0ABD5V675_9EURY